jgi:acyl carrier protein
MKSFLELLEKRFPEKRPLVEDLRLKEDLRLDSIDLIKIAVEVHQIFGVDLGEFADRGQLLNTIADIEKCIVKK